MSTDQELKETFKVFFDDDNILHVDFLGATAGGKENTRRAELVAESVYQFIEFSQDEAFNIIVDLQQMEKSTLSFGANRIYQWVARRPEIKKIAIVGDKHKQSRVLKYVLSFIKKSLDNKVRWFDQVDEAKTWLQEDAKNR